MVKILTLVLGRPISFVRLSPATPRETYSRTWKNWRTKIE